MQRKAILHPFVALISCALLGASPQAPSTASLAGIAIDVTAQQTLAGVRINIGNATANITTASDDKGRFSVRVPEPGRYFVAPQLNGFVIADPVTLDFKARGVWVVVRAAEQPPTVELRMVRTGVISGRALDSSGLPRPGSMSSVRLSTPSYDEYGERALNQPGKTLFGQMDDRGEYRFPDLQPGEYFLSVADSSQIGASSRVRGAIYPGVTDFQQATPIHIGPGQEVKLNTMSLVRESATQLRLRLLESPLDRTITTVSYGGDAFMFPTLPGTAAEPVHRVTVPAKTSGHHEVWVTVASPRGAMVGSTAVDLSQDIEVDVPLKRAPAVTGSVVVVNPNGQTKSISQPKCVLRPIPPKGILLTKPCIGIQAVPGFYRLEFQDLPEDAYLASAKVQGTDILVNGINIDADTRIEVVLKTPAASVAGIVSDGHGGILNGAVVAVVPDGQLRDVGPFYRSAISDVAGKFEIGGIAPGSYHIFAWKHIDGAAYRNREFMKEFEEKGMPLLVEGTARTSMNVTAF